MTSNYCQTSNTFWIPAVSPYTPYSPYVPYYPWAGPSRCPNCGYCPHCGRSGYGYNSLGVPYTPCNATAVTGAIS